MQSIDIATVSNCKPVSTWQRHASFRGCGWL